MRKKKGFFFHIDFPEQNFACNTEELWNLRYLTLMENKNENGNICETEIITSGINSLALGTWVILQTQLQVPWTL